MKRAPLIGITSDHITEQSHSYFSAGERYVKAVLHGIKGTPVILPAISEDASILKRLDGLLLTGAYSNINPALYHQEDLDENGLKDPIRDAFNLSIIPNAIDLEIPILGICRGIQEMNVAMGGTLHQKVNEQPGLNDHREDRTKPIHVQYGPSHKVIIQSQGLLSELVAHNQIKLASSEVYDPTNNQLTVNSVHGQGINTLGEYLQVEALGEDGLIEAVSIKHHPFAIAVQWHPEWQFQENTFSKILFKAFQTACINYQKEQQIS